MYPPEWLAILADLVKKAPLLACVAGLTLLGAAHLARLVLAIATFFVEMLAEDLADCRQRLTRFRRAVNGHAAPSDDLAAPPPAIKLVPRESHLSHAKRSTLQLRARRKHAVEMSK